MASIYDFELTSIKGKEISLNRYRGEVLLIVNTASKCGFVSQYHDLVELKTKYKDQGFEIIAFPSNNFANQEPGDNDEIDEFCSERYRINFFLHSKVSVRGKLIHPLYQFLTTETEHKGSIKWNFTKFLVDRSGNIVARFSPMKSPASKDVHAAIEYFLGEEVINQKSEGDKV